MTPGDAAAVRLPVHRPARVHAQRHGLHLRPGRPPLAGRRRDRRGEPADRRAGRPTGSRPGRRTGGGSRSPRTGGATPTSSAAGHPRRRRRGRGRSRPSRAARGRCSSRRPGCRTARRSRRSATAGRAAPGAGTTSGSSPPTAATTPTGGRNLSARHDLMPGSGMSSDVTRGEAPAPGPSADGCRWLHSAPRSTAPTSSGGSASPTAGSSA